MIHFHKPITTYFPKKNYQKKSLDRILDGAKKRHSPQYDQNKIYWLENFPEKDGLTSIIVMDENQNVTNLTGEKYSIQSKVHEYGGGAYIVKDGKIIFVNSSDQNLYQINKTNIKRITRNPSYRFGDLSMFQDNIYFILEEHKKDNITENFLATLNLNKPEKIQKLASGSSFYSNPRVSNDGKKLLWLQWDLPYMPWEASELWVGTFNEKKTFFSDSKKIDGGQASAIFQPEWINKEKIYYIKEESNYGKLFSFYKHELKKLIDINIDLSRPLWNLGFRSYGILNKNNIFASGWKEGELKFLKIDTRTKEYHELAVNIETTDQLCITKDYIIVSGSDNKHSNELFVINRNNLLKMQKLVKVINKRNRGLIKINNKKNRFYILHYPPRKKIYKKPPLIISIHGGPTANSKRGYSEERAYWNNNGFGYIEVDYRGSTGYGTDYIRALNGKWGLLDTSDVIETINFTLRNHLYEADKIILKGSSAGGMTLLNVLAENNNIPCACCYYPVSDIQKLLTETHKFESGYTRTLIGDELLKIDSLKLFNERSPIKKIDKINTPVIFFQGIKDSVVPQDQTRSIHKKLLSKGINTKLYEFDDEGHGFRSKDTLLTCRKAEREFYKKILSLK
tara:strand:- start:6450 stop:8318 length:1869 start_codon:yes stop_codon:yes gene_type:complete